jgi:hypothetical protein
MTGAAAQPEQRTSKTLFEVLGMDEAAVNEFQQKLTERLDRIAENERQAWIAAQGVWLR